MDNILFYTLLGFGVQVSKFIEVSGVRFRVSAKKSQRAESDNFRVIRFKTLTPESA
jgi:hypothetical protein